jgi:hypothetical protein
MFVTGLIRMRRHLDTKISPKKILHNKLKRADDEEDEKKHVQNSNFQK